MKKPTTKSDQTRAQIIDGALRAMSKTGVIGTTTRQIATEAGVQLATLHYHFDSKSALLVAVLEAYIDDMAARLRRQQVKSGADLDDGIEQLLLGIWRSVMRTKSIQIVQYELTLYALREGAEWLAERQYAAYHRLYHEHLMSITQGPRQLPAAACDALARFILAGVDGLILQELAKPSRARSKRGIDALIAATQAYAHQLAQ
ncbi:TetR/AcrR family transcriptional regulator [Phreatobacter stygius]|uniref:TetR/AcrR family transcriptional regulator n=1 Tax=Phreatobacter stygius TaxID=1940610 RepID=A0A4D7B871_9HYPH|nr:TetR/AcrR family transcriptional regulator [Phreatobacter stygius]QCI64187.1 TetR/AcrR family transcriptional regulator [Phreatobacter stygius]